jgi:hypothetical protein
VGNSNSIRSGCCMPRGLLGVIRGDGEEWPSDEEEENGEAVITLLGGKLRVFLVVLWSTRVHIRWVAMMMMQ